MAENDQFPEALIAALRKADKARLLVPPELDVAILQKARANIARGRRRKLTPWLAAAAALMIASIVILTPAPKAREDVNRDGRVDIRDALVLARKISDGKAQGLVWDFNHDGRVDQADVAAIAALAVKL
jgi:hypothetical protein